jgi:hypothetical protein
MHDDKKGGSAKPQPGNIPQLPKAGWTSNDLRMAWAEWCRAEVASWSSVHFVTLNFRASILVDAGAFVRLDQLRARAEVKRFGNRVDRAAFGNQVKRFNKQILRVAVLEYGMDRGWHCHLAMEKPPEMAEVRFVKVLKEAWSKSDWSSGPPDVRGAETDLVGYLTKYRSKAEMESWSDAIIPEATVTRTKYVTSPT